MSKPHLLIAHELWRHHLQGNETVIDATSGNGHDALYLSTLLKEGELHCLDIQKEAIEATKKRLSSYKKAHFHHSCHTRFPVDKAHLIVYNLGYLPGGNKALTTLTHTTLESLKVALSSLYPLGLITLTCYSGHEEGSKEEKTLLGHLSSLPKETFEVCHYQWINYRAHPSLFSIKLKH